MNYDGIRRWPQFRRDEFIVKHTINVQKCLVQFSCPKNINLHTSFWVENNVFYGVRCAYRDARPRHSDINSKAKFTARRGGGGGRGRRGRRRESLTKRNRKDLNERSRAPRSSVNSKMLKICWIISATRCVAAKVSKGRHAPVPRPRRATRGARAATTQRRRKSNSNAPSDSETHQAARGQPTESHRQHETIPDPAETSRIPGRAAICATVATFVGSRMGLTPPWGRRRRRCAERTGAPRAVLRRPAAPSAPLRSSPHRR